MGVVVWILLVHYVGDFLLQTQKQAENKSKSNEWLTYHVISYTAMLLIGGMIMEVSLNMFYWVMINGFLHWCTDWATSRATAELWKLQKIRPFFWVIGLDQLVHTACLLCTYQAMV